MEDTVNYLILALLWIAYFVLHSTLASVPVKTFFKTKAGRFARFYRLTYSLVAILSLLPILFYNALISQNWLLPTAWKEILTIIGLVLATYGIIIIRMAFRQYSLKIFLGIRQLEDQALEEDFSKEGILSVVRHPLYTGTILILAGFWVYAPTLANLVTVMMLTVYILIGIRLEEKKLVAQYGEEYQRYQAKVPMLIPRRGSLKQLRNK